MRSASTLIPSSLLVLLLGLLVGGCGPDESDGEDAIEGGRPTAAALLEALSTRVAEGRGISDVTWTMDVQEVAMALWPDDSSQTALAARRDHTNAAHIAGDMARRIAADPGVRAVTLESDPTSIEIHDAFVAASVQGEEAYRSWIENEGRALLEARVRAIAGERPPR